MITYNGKEYLNLEEQVLRNKQDIAAHYNIDRVLAEFGIKVIGQVDNATLLPNPATFAGAYGDAYAVGAEAPYSFYIWTRADSYAGHDEDYWFNIGPLAIVGPEGPQGETGPQGPQGERGTKWSWMTATSDIPPSATDDPIEGDFVLNTETGTLWRRGGGNTWIRSGNIMGPQGPQGEQGLQGERGLQGPQGEKGQRGDVGGLVQIRGIVPAADQLISPVVINNLTAAYLVGTAEPYDLYVQVGAHPATAMWVNTGPLNAATLVFENGVAQGMWDADSKVNSLGDEIPSTNVVYGRNAINPVDITYTLSSTSALFNTIPQRNINGTFVIGDALFDNEAANLKQVKAGRALYKLNLTLKITGEYTLSSGETVSEINFKTSIYKGTDDISLNEVWLGTNLSGGTAAAYLTTQPWTGDLKYSGAAGTNKLCYILGHRRNAASSDYSLALIIADQSGNVHRITVPKDQFSLQYGIQQIK